MALSLQPANYEPSFNVVLHQPAIPPNTGNIGRTCVALRAKLWLVRPLGFRMDEKALRRAGLDYWQHLNWQAVDDWAEMQRHALDQSADPTFWMFTKKAQQSYCKVQYQPGDWLVFGSETSGLPDSMLTEPKRNLRVPMYEQVRSLNLASTVALASYEIARQISLFD